MMPTTMRLLRQATRFKRSVNQNVARLERFNGDGRIGHGFQVKPRGKREASNRVYIAAYHAEHSKNRA